ncbi:MAG TPA: D-alanyl-D-alanine carboxypeptidase family protein [Gammaproteobacteria bacterium]|nr:D-alanyl-D-alanine carboxypeptidase family protein [Gammaproteobacteria bacterium]
MRSKFLLACFLSCITVAAHALPIPAPPQFPAKSYVLMDAHSGQVIAEYNGEQRREPASLTKLMTAYVVFHALKDGVLHLDDTATVSERAWKMGGSRMFAKLGDRIKVDELLQGMVVQSGNDATVALAERVGGTEDAFVQIMNQYAQKLGMVNTHYVDASGLTNDKNHYMSARDLGLLSRALIGEFPEYLHYFSQKIFVWNKISQGNRNDLLYTDTSVDGLKTGDTDDAGYCLVATALRGDLRLIAVVMGTKTRPERGRYAETLLNYGSNFFETRKLYAAGATVADVKVWKGADESVATGLTQDMYVTLPKSGDASLQANAQTSAGLIAPVADHSQVGMLNVTVDGHLLTQAPLYTMKAVPEGGFFHRLVDSVRLWFSKKKS